jgi:hypothetical protein
MAAFKIYCTLKENNFTKGFQTWFYTQLIASGKLLECVATQSVGSVTVQSRVNGWDKDMTELDLIAGLLVTAR